MKPPEERAISNPLNACTPSMKKIAASPPKTTVRATRKFNKRAVPRLKPDVKQNSVVSHLLRQFMKYHGDSRRQPNRESDYEARGNNHAVDEVVNSIADEVQVSEPLGSCAVGQLGGKVGFMAMSVVPIYEPFEEEEKDKTDCNVYKHDSISLKELNSLGKKVKVCRSQD